LFQPTHPIDDDEGDVTDFNESHQLETQDFFYHGIRQPNEGTYFLTFRISATQQNFQQYSILILLLFAHLGDEYVSYRVFGEGANSDNVHEDPYDLIYQATSTCRLDIN